MENKVNYEFIQNNNDLTVIDVRSKEYFEFGHIPGAKNVFISDSKNIDYLLFEKEKKYCLYSDNDCDNLVDEFVLKGYDVVSLAGGYNDFLKTNFANYEGGFACREIEKSLQKKFRKQILSKFLRAIKEYNLIEANDKIAVCISGGKDSILMAKLFQELLRFSEKPFSVEYLVMDPGYNKINRELIEHNARLLNIPIKIFETNIFENVVNIEKSPCYLCARMRRGYLYNEAKKLGCNKIALGHHFDDVIETTLMGMLYGGQVQTMMPKLHSSNFEGMQLIRPMFLIREEDIKHWRDYNKLKFLQCACKFTEMCYGENCADAVMESKRKKVKELIALLKKDDEQVDENIFKSVQNVNLSTILEYKDKNGIRHNFLDDYDSYKND